MLKTDVNTISLRSISVLTWKKSSQLRKKIIKVNIVILNIVFTGILVKFILKIYSLTFLIAVRAYAIYTGA